MAARRKAAQALRQHIAADRIENGVDALAAGVLFDRLLEIDFGVDDDLVGAELAHEIGLILGRDRGVNIRAQHFRHLHQLGADAAGGGMDQHPFAGLRPMRIVQQTLPDAGSDGATSVALP